VLPVSTPFSLLPCESAHGPDDVCLFLSLSDVRARIARERVPTTCNSGSRPLSRVSPDRALAIRLRCSLWHLHLESRYPRNERYALIRNSYEGALRHAIRTDYVIALIGETLSRTKTRKLADHAVTFDDNLLTQLVSDHPFPASNGDRFGRLIIDRDKVNKRVGPVRWRLECWHIDNFVDEHTKIRQFSKH
jgi:hypothetical protein